MGAVGSWGHCRTVGDPQTKKTQQPLTIGFADIDAGQPKRYFDGHMAQLRIMNRALTTDEFLNLPRARAHLTAPPADMAYVSAGPFWMELLHAIWGMLRSDTAWDGARFYQGPLGAEATPADKTRPEPTPTAPPSAPSSHAARPDLQGPRATKAVDRTQVVPT